RRAPLQEPPSSAILLKLCTRPGAAGAVAEWSKALAWKVSIRQKRIEGSNPSRSAKLPARPFFLRGSSEGHFHVLPCEADQRAHGVAGRAWFAVRNSVVHFLMIGHGIARKRSIASLEPCRPANRRADRAR